MISSAGIKLPLAVEADGRHAIKGWRKVHHVALAICCMLIAYQCLSLEVIYIPRQHLTVSRLVAAARGAPAAALAAAGHNLHHQASANEWLPSGNLPSQQVTQADHFNVSRCPAWLAQYEQWHTANRGLPGAKYLLADAPGFVGVGDHLRGFMYALRAAAATHRVLLLRWEHPGNLTDFLVPGSGINWTLSGTPAEGLVAEDPVLRQATADKDVYTNNDFGRVFPDQRFFSHDPSNKTFLVIKTNFPAGQACASCPAVKPSGAVRARDYDHVCLFKYLFRTSPLVNMKTDEYLQQLYPDHSQHSSAIAPVYQAVHLRLGQMPGESSSINRVAAYGDPLAMLLLSVACGMGQASGTGIDTQGVPLLLLADHQGVRQFSQNGFLTDVVTPAYQAVHTKVNSVESHLLSFVDLNLLARSKCMVLSHSGFSDVAWWLSGGNPCMLLLSDCYEQCASNWRSSASCPSV